MSIIFKFFSSVTTGLLKLQEPSIGVAPNASTMTDVTVTFTFQIVLSFLARS